MYQLLPRNDRQAVVAAIFATKSNIDEKRWKRPYDSRSCQKAVAEI